MVWLKLLHEGCQPDRVSSSLCCCMPHVLPLLLPLVYASEGLAPHRALILLVGKLGLMSRHSGATLTYQFAMILSHLVTLTYQWPHILLVPSPAFRGR